MALASGSRLGAYEVVSLLGEGGMGEVYRAKDTRLKRDVALKILPDAFAGDPDRVARFQREAELLATLNHPNIAGIYGVEQADGIRALVLELVEGPTLADRIARGPIPIDEALVIANQIADALEAAHERGVIHRDLKPANIKLTADDKVKVLDFGLAKMLENPAAPTTLSMSPTLSVHATYAGVILGTAAYMSPEQARGKAVDKRTDIWAFGCVLFEMLTGTPPFQGDDIAEVMGAIIHKDIALERLPAKTPASVRMVLARCLEKDAKERMPDIGDVRLALRGAFGAAAPSVSPVASSSGRSVLRVVGIVVAFVAILAAAGITGWALRSVKPPQLMQFTIVPPAEAPLSMTNIVESQLAISPDGSMIAYLSGVAALSGAGGNPLIVRAIDRLEPRALPDVNARAPFFSPDGQWIGFVTGASGPELRKVSVTGGPAVTICRVDGGPRGASWGRDGSVVFATNNRTTGLMQVPAAGGEPRVLTRPNRTAGEDDHILPSVLPDGRGVLFTITSAQGGDAAIAVLDLRTGHQKTLIHGGSQAEYVAPGYLVYAYGGTLRAVGFDSSRLEVVGDPIPILDHVGMTPIGAAMYSVSQTGTLIYAKGSGSGVASSLVWVDRHGGESAIAAPSRVYVVARLSPDGSRVAVEIRDQENDIWMWDFAHETLTRLTFDLATEAWPVWTPDGRHIVFNSTRTLRPNLFWRAADGTGSEERLTTSTNAQWPLSFAPDGKSLVVREEATVSSGDVRRSHLRLVHFDSGSTLPASGNLSSLPLLETHFSEVNGEISPDGHWIAYDSNESGNNQVYVRPFPNVEGGRWQISSRGGSRPAWNPNNRELFYFDNNTNMIAVPVQTSPAFSVGTATKLFDGPWSAREGTRPYDVSHDGQRFLMIKDVGSSNNEIDVVVNWVEELKRRVSTK